jgi:signal transduction histidine kinase/CheY-like chemotaxis protein
VLVPRARSIRAKLALLIAASLAAAVFLSLIVSSYRELSRFAEAKRAEIEATAQVLAAVVADAVAESNRSLALQALDSIGRIPAVNFAEIRDATGGLLAEAGTGVVLTSGGMAETDRPSFWSMLLGRSYFVTADVVRGGRKIGQLNLLVDTSDLLVRFRQAAAAAVVSAAAAILVGLVIAARLQRSITRPLGELAETMNRVRATSDFSQRARRRSEDETGQLVDAFNDMLDQIGTRDAALEEHRAGLERTVSERTRELAEARDVAVSASRAKSDFLATMSHEIRTPLNGMLVVAELLARGDLPARQLRYAEIISRSGQTLLSIINDILDLSKIEAGKLTLEKGRIDPAQVVADVLGLFWERAACKNLDLAADIAPDVPDALEGDPVRLSQIISNLVNNALKFTERGHVSVDVQCVSAGAEACVLQFSVSDTGIGIPADKLAQVFEAFTQADSSTTRRFGGTGLGLSISQRLVHAMGGRIWAESTPGSGSRFCFTIQAPVLQKDASGGCAAPAEVRRAAIAVMGDATRQALARGLAEAGYEVVGFSSDLALIADVQADVVFVEHRVLLQHASANLSARLISVATPAEASEESYPADDERMRSITRPVISRDVTRLLNEFEPALPRQILEARQDYANGPPLRPHLRVLVADDSAVNLEVTKEVLTLLGANCLLVADGAEAVAAFRDERFDLVLMDGSMPVKDGFEATREIRRHEAKTGAARTPVIALTAHADAGAPWRAADMDDHLLKPITIKSLSNCLERWVPASGHRASRVIEAGPNLAASGTPRSKSDTDPLDPDILAGLRQLGKGTDALLVKLLGLFLSHAPAQRLALDNALAAGDLELVAIEAHALKSPSRNIGALALARHLEAVETRSRAGDRSILTDPVLDALATEYRRVLSALDRLTAKQEEGASAQPIPSSDAA